MFYGLVFGVVSSMGFEHGAAVPTFHAMTAQPVKRPRFVEFDGLLERRRPDLERPVDRMATNGMKAAGHATGSENSAIAR